jgi:cell cycle arrest protein BUB3
MESETYLKDIPSDGITKLEFGETSDNLLVTSWDSTCSLYDGYGGALKYRYQSKAAVLSADFTEDETGAYIGGLEQKVRKIDFATNDETDLGHHDDAVR